MSRSDLTTRRPSHNDPVIGGTGILPVRIVRAECPHHHLVRRLTLFSHESNSNRSLRASAPRRFISLCAAITVTLASCTRDTTPTDQPATQAAATTKPSLWKSIDPASPVAVVSPVNESKLRAAMEQARSTAEQARQKWLYTPADDRPRWSVKWAAPVAGKPTDSGGTEHVWVSPVRWSPFRIEGVLASTPVNDLACGKHLGELVSFPIEELSDWIHFTTIPASAANADPTAPHEGGFTVQLLAEEYGNPGLPKQ